MLNSNRGTALNDQKKRTVLHARNLTTSRLYILAHERQNVEEEQRETWKMLYWNRFKSELGGQLWR